MDLTDQTYTYTDSEKAELFIAGLRSSNECSEESKKFNLCQAKLPNSLVTPEICKNESKSIIDCFLKVYFK